MGAQDLISVEGMSWFVKESPQMGSNSLQRIVSSILRGFHDILCRVGMEANELTRLAQSQQPQHWHGAMQFPRPNVYQSCTQGHDSQSPGGLLPHTPRVRALVTPLRLPIELGIPLNTL